MRGAPRSESAPFKRRGRLDSGHRAAENARRRARRWAQTGTNRDSGSCIALSRGPEHERKKPISRPFLSGANRDRTGDLLLAKSAGAVGGGRHRASKGRTTGRLNGERASLGGDVFR